MMVEKNGAEISYKHYLPWLYLCFFLFLFRVAAQLIQKFYPLPFLPPFEAWYSGALAYSPRSFRLIRPSEGLQIAYDPRIPSDRQAFEFVADGIAVGRKVEWVLNGKTFATTDGGHLVWPVERGHHTLTANEIGDREKIISSDIVHFNVK